MDRMSVRYSFYILGKCFPNMQKNAPRSFSVKILKIFPKKKIKFIDIIRKNEYSLF